MTAQNVPGTGRTVFLRQFCDDDVTIHVQPVPEIPSPDSGPWVEMEIDVGRSMNRPGFHVALPPMSMAETQDLILGLTEALEVATMIAKRAGWSPAQE